MVRWLIVFVLVAGMALAAFLLKPVIGPARDLTLVGDVARGEYLIRLGGCVACHTDIKGQGAFLAGGVPLKTPFGSFVPPNITSDKDAGIGDWTLAEFSSAMSEGMGPGTLEHYYPAFPYNNYSLMSDQEIADLFAALMEVEPVAAKAGEHSIMFPFNIRLAMAGWKNLFFTPTRYEADPSRSQLWNRGRYLAVGPAHCVACHTPRNALGALDNTRHLMGSEAGGPAGKVPGIDTQTLIASGYDRAWLVDVFKGGVTTEFDVPGGAMNEVINESMASWKEQDLEAMAAYLLDED